jgi:hypothetical protein
MACHRVLAVAVFDIDPDTAGRLTIVYISIG